jgi:t-SNARE complex subunit (syntaxin)
MQSQKVASRPKQQHDELDLVEWKDVSVAELESEVSQVNELFTDFAKLVQEQDKHVSMLHPPACPHACMHVHCARSLYWFPPSD